MQKLKNIFHLFISWFFTLLYGYPIKKLKVIFVTGTDGKTTTSFMIYQTLSTAGKKVGIVSTVEARVGDKKYDTGLHTTTPANADLQRIIVELVKEECEYVIIELTSHGIDQHRVVGARPIASVITNITKEHLDYSGSYDNLINTKARVLKWAQKGFINKDDPAVGKLEEYAKANNSAYEVYDKNDVRDKLSDEWKNRFPGEYNLENAAAAASVCAYLGLSDAQIYVGLGTVKAPKGRFEPVPNNRGFNLYIDFAHTPNALKAVLVAMKQKHPQGNLIVVFGCAGLRDRYKRPVMGEYATKLADFAVITAEDPRTEGAVEISEQIAQGAQKAGGIENKTYYLVPDRQGAITFAVNKLAKEGDTIVVTGKGHEESMNMDGKTETPWSDLEAVKKALEK